MTASALVEQRQSALRDEAARGRLARIARSGRRGRRSPAPVATDADATAGRPAGAPAQDPVATPQQPWWRRRRTVAPAELADVA